MEKCIFFIDLFEEICDVFFFFLTVLFCLKAVSAFQCVMECQKKEIRMLRYHSHIV